MSLSIEICLRLLTAVACGAVIGLNRDLRGKPAGFRTFGLVSLGSAAVTLVLVDAGADPLSRVIQGLLTGIGFLGAGVILHRDKPHKIVGLTTAAAVWLTAGLGVAAGAGKFAIVWPTLVIAMLLLILGGPFERFFTRMMHSDDESQGEDDSQKPMP